MWEFDLLIWETHRKHLYNYDENNKLVQQTALEANNQHNGWINDWKVINSFNENDLIQKEEYFIWLTDADSWFEDYKFIHHYDTELNLTQRVGYIYDWHEEMLCPHCKGTGCSYYNNGKCDLNTNLKCKNDE